MEVMTFQEKLKSGMHVKDFLPTKLMTLVKVKHYITQLNSTLKSHRNCMEKVCNGNEEK